MLEGSFTDEGIGAVKAIFEGGFKFSAYRERKKFDSTASAVQREEDITASPYTQEHQNWRIN